MSEIINPQDTVRSNVYQVGLAVGASILSLSSLSGCDAFKPEPIPDPNDPDRYTNQAYCEDLKVTILSAKERTVSVTSDYFLGTGPTYEGTSYVFGENIPSVTVDDSHERVVYDYHQQPHKQAHNIFAVVNYSTQDAPGVYGSIHMCEETVTFGK